MDGKGGSVPPVPPVPPSMGAAPPGTSILFGALTYVLTTTPPYSCSERGSRVVQSPR